jgi:hypothetical protein
MNTREKLAVGPCAAANGEEVLTFKPAWWGQYDTGIRLGKAVEWLVSNLAPLEIKLDTDGITVTWNERRVFTAPTSRKTITDAIANAGAPASSWDDR